MWSDVFLNPVKKPTEISEGFVLSLVDQSQCGKMGRDVPNLKKEKGLHLRSQRHY